MLDNSSDVIISTRAAGESSVPLISNDLKQLFQVINYVVICCLLSLFGIVANIINVAVYARHGFTDSITVSLCAVSASDFCCLATLLWFVVCANPLLADADISFVPAEFQHLTAGWPHVCFSRISCAVTVFITLERCLCIAVPLRVRLILTPKRAAVIISTIFIVFFLSVIPTYASSRIGWKFYPKRNKTLLGLVRDPNFQRMEAVTLAISVTLQVISFVTLIISTIVLTVELKRKAKWRKLTANSGNDTASRDQKLGKMIIFMSSILIVCYTPGVTINLVKMFIPEFTVAGLYENWFIVAWSFGGVFQATTSSVNIFIYYNMSSKYRATFNSLILRKRDEIKKKLKF